MAYRSGHRHIYYYELQGQLNILADERDKKKLLDIVLGIQQTQTLEVYAFCITDEAFCLMLEGAKQADINLGVRKIIADFAAYHLDSSRIRGAAAAGMKLTVAEKRYLRSQPEILQQCRLIHQIPVSKGYVKSIRNYWWSSYRTYMGYYDWKQVNSNVILQMFSNDRDSARRQFRRFHDSYPDNYPF